MEALWKQSEGQWVDKSYCLRKLIGWGTFGGVFRADHFIGKKFVQTVAVKLIVLDPSESKEEIDRKLDELVTAITLHHDYLLRCSHAGIAEVGPASTKFLYLVMELAEYSPGSRLKKGVLSTAEAADLIEQVASGLVSFTGVSRIGISSRTTFSASATCGSCRTSG